MRIGFAILFGSFGKMDIVWAFELDRVNFRVFWVAVLKGRGEYFRNLWLLVIIGCSSLPLRVRIIRVRVVLVSERVP